MGRSVVWQCSYVCEETHIMHERSLTFVTRHMDMVIHFSVVTFEKITYRKALPGHGQIDMDEKSTVIMQLFHSLDCKQFWK
jgi:hypothetical protein